jgi:hypothetical protein
VAILSCGEVTQIGGFHPSLENMVAVLDGCLHQQSLQTWITVLRGLHGVLK